VPRRLEFAALPRTETGKLAKRRLRDPYWTESGRRI
jgi:long-chain acyl-CoA synthetase